MPFILVQYSGGSPLRKLIRLPFSLSQFILAAKCQYAFWQVILEG
jgi:hypothetical protein